MDDKGRIYAHGVEDVIKEMRQEFLDEGGDALRGIHLTIGGVRQGQMTMDALVKEVLRLSRFLHAQAVALDMPLIPEVSSRMEDYLANAKSYPPHALEDLEAFAELLLDILEGRVDPDTDPAKLVRGLPPKATFEVGDIEVRNVEVMLVMHHDAAAHFVERELQQCGYRTSIVSSTLKAIPMILRTKPDLVVVSAVMPDLGGIDLAIGFAALPANPNAPTDRPAHLGQRK